MLLSDQTGFGLVRATTAASILETILGLLHVGLIYDYRFYSAIISGFPLSRMTTNNYISPMKVSYDTRFTI